MTNTFIEHKEKNMEKFRIFAIGDIHGMHSSLQSIHTKIIDELNSIKIDNNYIVYLGDYIDRGPDSKKTIQELIDFCPNAKKIFLCGNHDDYFRMFLTNKRFTSFLSHLAIGGGKSTYLSYGINIIYDNERISIKNSKGIEICQEKHIIQEIISKIPVPHIEFFLSLNKYFQIGKYIFAHAGINQYQPMDKQSNYDLMMERHHNFMCSSLYKGKLLIYGHTFCQSSFEPIITDHSIGIDTGSFINEGKLTCLVLNGANQPRFLFSTPN